MATSAYNHLSNYMMFNNVDGIYTFSYKSEKKENCIVCGTIKQELQLSKDDTLFSFINTLARADGFNLQKPTLTTVTFNGENKTLYVSNLPQLEEQLRPNLEKTIYELDLRHGSEITVTDPGIKMPLTFKLVISD